MTFEFLKMPMPKFAPETQSRGAILGQLIFGCVPMIPQAAVRMVDYSMAATDPPIKRATLHFLLRELGYSSYAKAKRRRRERYGLVARQVKG